ncbi:MAG: C39 family peptidase [Chloroflexota bacterium]|nr:C39 family peptidase [Chloroflexota bacterium]
MKSSRTVILIGALVVLGVALLATPTLIRALPGRYAVYLPEPLQEMRHNPHPDTLPTPVITHTQPSPSPTETPSPSPSPTQTPPPTDMPPATDTPHPTDTPAPSPTASPTPRAAFSLAGVRHDHQRWNNCGPTTLAMALSYWDRDETQMDIAPVLKPDPEDKNVSPWEMATYARDLGLGATVRVNGTLDRLKTLVRAGFPVLVETWHVRDARDQLGHYRLIVGYDDAAQHFLTYDSLNGPDVTVGYREMDELWRVFNRLYLVVYQPGRWEDLAALLGPDTDDTAMYEAALDRARAEAAEPPDSCVAYADCGDWVTFSHFNVGTNLTALNRHAEAAAAYDQARQLGLHYRMLWYQFGPYESYDATGRYDDVIALANATLTTANNLEESYYWRGKARVALGDTQAARSDFKAALRYHEGWLPAQTALQELDGS